MPARVSVGSRVEHYVATGNAMTWVMRPSQRDAKQSCARLPYVAGLGFGASLTCERYDAFEPAATGLWTSFLLARNHPMSALADSGHGERPLSSQSRHSPNGRLRN